MSEKDREGTIQPQAHPEDYPLKQDTKLRIKKRPKHYVYTDAALKVCESTVAVYRFSYRAKTSWVAKMYHEKGIPHQGCYDIINGKTVSAFCFYCNAPWYKDEKSCGHYRGCLAPVDEVIGLNFDKFVEHSANRADYWVCPDANKYKGKQHPRDCPHCLNKIEEIRNQGGDEHWSGLNKSDPFYEHYTDCKNADKYPSHKKHCPTCRKKGAPK